MKYKNKLFVLLLVIILIIIAIFYLMPFYVVIINSFKNQVDIIQKPFIFPKSFNFNNYIRAIKQIQLLSAFFHSLYITVFSVIAILLFTSMTAWMLVRVKTIVSKILFFVFLGAMVVPFQLVMFPMVYVAANWFNLCNSTGIIILYLGFGSSLSVFMFYGFIKGIPFEIEEAAVIDGCGPIKTFFYIIVPNLKSIYITVAILNSIWIWNDYLMPSLILPSEQRTIPVAIQYLVGSFGSIDYSAMMAAITVAIIPVILFYFLTQKYIIEGVTAGSIK